MTATLHRLSGLHGHGLAALERATAIVEEGMRTSAIHVSWKEREAAKSALPPIVRETCAMCTDGSYTIGTRRYVCSLCNGRGTIAVEA